jgi:ABC-2 type transport system permease protein
LNAVLVIAHRDLVKLLRDVPRMLATFVFPFIFIGALGGSLQASLGNRVGFDFLGFTFTGVFAQTLWQSAAMGLISLIEDRENDFSQEIFVSPVSRYTIVFGKIVGETLVALPQGLAIIVFGLVLGVPTSPLQVLALALVGIPVCLFGGAFGLLVLSNLGSQRAAQQIFPFFILPQFFLAGVFSPIQDLPLVLDVLSRISPMRYAVDLTRGIFYLGQPDYAQVVVDSPLTNTVVMAALFLAFLLIGTLLFVRAERNR